MCYVFLTKKFVLATDILIHDTDEPREFVQRHRLYVHECGCQSNALFRLQILAMKVVHEFAVRERERFVRSSLTDEARRVVVVEFDSNRRQISLHGIDVLLEA